MSINQGDLRVRRTRRMLQDALVALVAEQGFEAVTIQALTQRAMVNRTTFYLHYDDKYDLLLDVVGETFRPVRDNPLLFDDANWSPGGPAPDWLVDFLTRLDENAAFYRGVLGVGGSERLRSDLQTYFAGLIEQRISRAGITDATSTVPPPVVAMVMASAALGSLAWWLDQDPRDSPEQSATWYLDTVTLGVFRVLGITPPAGRPGRPG